jgi:hypothetical protein
MSYQNSQGCSYTNMCHYIPKSLTTEFSQESQMLPVYGISYLTGMNKPTQQQFASMMGVMSENATRHNGLGGMLNTIMESNAQKPSIPYNERQYLTPACSPQPDFKGVCSGCVHESSPNKQSFHPRRSKEEYLSLTSSIRGGKCCIGNDQLEMP